MSAETKLELLGLIDAATAQGWPHLRACAVLELADVRAHRWRARLRETGSLEDLRPVGNAVHRILAWEEQAILDLIERWAWVDRSHRKLAHRGSYTGTVFVSPSTLLRVALKHQVKLPEDPFRPAARARPALPEVPWEPNRIWIWDASHFPRTKRVAYAIVDVVTRYWIGYLLSSEQTSTQAQLLFATALEDQGLVDGSGQRVVGEDGLPVLIAWSDNGSEMTATDTRGFMALMTIHQHHGRPGTPTDQAHVESFFSHLKGDWPHLTSITDPGALDTELA
ncbi:MAG: DDE-type integrase/transposase/recombinase, partial [Solirubrobacterales bacterium]